MSIQRYSVLDTTYHCHTKPDGTTIIEIRYKIGENQIYNEYLNFETENDRAKAIIWWRKRSFDPTPKSNQHAVDSANYHALAITKTITVENLRYGYRIKDYTIGELPPRMDVW
jgi:hypothetical protein